jgi:hypothetical protein
MLALLALVVGLQGASAAEITGLRLTAMEKDSAVIAIDLDEDAVAAVRYGEAPMAWTGDVTSPAPASHHELRLTGLVPDRQVFYHVVVDGQPAGDVLTFRGGRSWVTRSARVLVSGDVPSGSSGDTEHADDLFSEVADVLVLLGGDGGSPTELARLHRRSFTDRLVVATGGPGDTESPRLVIQADVAVALLGDGDVAHAASWAASALAATPGACWRVLASARSIDRTNPALVAAAAATAADVVVTRGGSTSFTREDQRVWVTLADPDAPASASMARAHLVLESTEERLLATVVGEDGASSTLSKKCPIPGFGASAHSAPADSDDPGESLTSDADAAAEDCDTR